MTGIQLQSLSSHSKFQTPETVALRAADKAHLWHPFTPMSLWLESDPLVIVAADGMHLIDSDGNRYLDGVSSLWCNVHGHRVPEIDQAIRDQLDRVAHTTMLGLTSEPAIRLAERLMKIVPAGLTKVFYSDAGATATEIAFKLAAQYWFNAGQPQRTQFVGFTEAYHGDTVGAMSVGRTTAFHKPYFPMLFPVHFAPTPRSGADAVHCLNWLGDLMEREKGKIAAVCIEPIVQGAAGMLIQPAGFLRKLRALTQQHNTLLIADEVATGFGRTGKMFACEHEGVSPDILCVAKGITGGYLPLAATFSTQRIFDAFLGAPGEGKTFFHGHTYTGNPLACAAALASLNLFEKNDLVSRVAQKAQHLSQLLTKLEALPNVLEIRQKGFMIGIELTENKQTRTPFDAKLRTGAKVCQNLRAHGVILRPLGDVIVMMPPLAMEMDDLMKIVSALEIEIQAVAPT